MTGNKEMETLYVVSVGYNGDEITSHCWGDGCGEGDCSGSLNICGGEFLICHQPKEKCPIHEEEKALNDTKLPSRDGPVDYHLVVRRLKKGASSREAPTPRTCARGRPKRL